MKKLVVSVLLLLSMVVSLLATTGCGLVPGGNREPLPDFEMPEGGFDTSKEVNITFYHTMGASLRKVLDDNIKAFNEIYPNIIVTHKQVGSYDDVKSQITTELTAHKQPNIAYCYPDHVASYNVSQAVVTLDQFIDSTMPLLDKDGNPLTDKDGNALILGLTQEQKDDYIAAYYNEGKQFGDDQMYCLPFSKSTEVLYYNKDYFEENGLTVPTTWDEMEAVCKKILEIETKKVTDKGGKAEDVKVIPLGYDSDANWFITMCEQLKSGYTSTDPANRFLFDNETNWNFVKRFSDWYDLGYVATEGTLGTYSSSMFATIKDGEIKSYMSIGSSAGSSYQSPGKDTKDEFPFEVGIAPIPQINPAEPKVISQGPSLCIFKNADPQEVMASWLFVKYFTTDVLFQAEFSQRSGYVPVIKSVMDNPGYKYFLEQRDGEGFIQALSAYQCMNQVDAYFVSPAFNASSTAREQVGKIMTNCFKQVEAQGPISMDYIKSKFKEALDICKYRANGK